MKMNHFSSRAKRWIAAILAPSFFAFGVPLQANPLGPQVSNLTPGVTFQGLGTSVLDINNPNTSAIINWQSFSIGAGEITRINQGSGAMTLNRVISGNPTEIYGTLQATQGGVMVINPNGVLVHQGGVIDVAGMMTLSTLDIDDSDFLDGGTSRFYGNSKTGVSNFGSISSSEGDVILLGGFVNNEGQIGAMNGTVALGSGGDILLHQSGEAKITIQGASDYDGTGVNNAAGATVRGAAVEMKAHGNIYALAINNGGTVRATGATRSNGRVRLMASGGSGNINLGSGSSIVAATPVSGGDIQVASTSGDVSVGGDLIADGQVRGGSVSVTGNTVTQSADSTVSANGVVSGGSVVIDSVERSSVDGAVFASATSGSGGSVDILARDVQIGNQADVSVDGVSEGGRIRVGGEFQGMDVGIREAEYSTVEAGASISADATLGDAGSVILWANHDTIFRGDISASAFGATGSGGFIEVSGKENLALGGTVAANAVSGDAGTVLFDPGEITVGYFNNAAGFNEIEIATVNELLEGGTSVIIMTEGAGGNIVFDDVDLAGMNAGGETTSGATGRIGAANNSIDFSDPNHPRNLAVQWTNSKASFGAFAGGDIILRNHIRTSGEGSINLIAGWGGSESDFSSGSIPFGNAFDFPVNGLSASSTTPAALTPQQVFDTYVSRGDFAQNSGSIFVGSKTMDRHVEVGSRYGDTSLAGFSINVTAADTNGESRHAQVGFRDSGQVFGVRFNNVVNAYDPDLNLRALELENNPAVAIAGNDFGQARDIDGDGLVDGVYVINQFGLLVDGAYSGTAGATAVTDHDNSGTPSAEELNGTFIPYATHYNSSRVGNYWWQQIHEHSKANRASGVYDPNDKGGNLPESGAGTAAKTADINLIAANDVNITAGGRSQSGAFVGHGGDNAGWADNRAIQNGGRENFGGGEEFVRRWSHNGGSNDTVANSIARLGAVYGNINVLAGVNPAAGVDYSDTGVVTATSSQTGKITVMGLQRLGSAANPASDEDGGAGGGAPAQIGHGGASQFGEFYGDINVQANGNIELIAGSQTRSSATIGHTINGGYNYWDPTNVGDAQVRFFRTSGDFNDPLLRRGELFSGSTNIAQAASGGFGNTNGDTFSGTRGGGRDLSDPTTSTVGLKVDALDGSVITGYHGDINVKSVNGGLNLVGFEIEDTSEDGSGSAGDLGLATRRADRFAKVGHGGTSRAFWAEESGYRPNGTNRNQELVNFRIRNTGAANDSDNVTIPGTNQADIDRYNTGSASIIGERDTSLNRSLTFMTITGDINVDVAGDVSIEAGNGIADYAQIGHGGYELADYETSSFIAGDITVKSGGAIDIHGVDVAATYGRRNNGQNRLEWEDTRDYALIGHGGWRSGFLSFSGDITVEAARDINIKAGIYEDGLAKIGHQTADDWGQSGGKFSRSENFFFDSVETDIQTVMESGNNQVTYTTGGNIIRRTFAYDTSADVYVHSGGDIKLSHEGEPLFWNARQRDLSTTTDSERRGFRINGVSAQIGHGGINTDALRWQNSAYDDADKAGKVTVGAVGNITLENGNGQERWARIGHGVGQGDRVDANNANFAQNAIELVGDIYVNATGSILVNAAAASEEGNEENATAPLRGPDGSLVGPVSRWNPVVIGHGGIRNNLDIVTLSNGEDVNGMAASSDITVVSGGSLGIFGGAGSEASYGQIGHGFASDAGNDAARRGGVATGFHGNISVTVGQDLQIQATDNAYYEVVGASVLGASTVGGFAAIGNGGYQLDAPISGDISVYAGRSAEIIGSQRTEGAPGDPGTDAQTIVSPENDNPASVGSGFHFAKIGHVNAENENGSNSNVTNAQQRGDVTVVIEQNLLLKGGTTQEGVESAPIWGAFAQIGNGGPGIAGDIEGDITVLVGGDFTALGGDRQTDARNTAGNLDFGLNNYAMIGNGDQIYRPGGSNQAVFQSEAFGARTGDIIVAIGGSGYMTDVLIGHGDPEVSNQATTGNTQIAVSRKFPFYGGSGVLDARESIFSSGAAGNGSRLQIYIPTRSNNQIADTTRLNETVGGEFMVAPADFTGFTGTGALSGRADEVYLAPDLWWDDAGFSGGLTVAAGVFPGDASGTVGGSIATVSDPGGVFNIDTLVAGALGSSSSVYRASNNVSGGGEYTIYYDAIEQVEFTFPPPPQPPAVIPPPIVFLNFNFAPLVFEGFFDAFDRDEDDVENGLVGDEGGLFGSVGLFESEEETHEESGATNIEEGLDSLFGSRRDRFSEEEEDEEERRKRERAARGVGPLGNASYVYYPGTNRYSSLRIFGAPEGE